MSLTISPARAEQKLVGAALRNIREARRKSQGQVGEILGMTAQGWQKHEAGERKLPDEKVDAVLAFLDSDREELALERARILGAPMTRPTGMETRARDFVFDVFGRARTGAAGSEIYDIASPMQRVDLRQVLGTDIGAMRMAGDSMVPWAEPGELVLFDRDAYPRRGAGCVIETDTGQAHVRRYEKTDGSTLYASELYPEPRMVTFDLRKVVGVYAVTLRGD